MPPGSSVDPVVAESVRGDDDHGGGGDEEALELEAAIASITEFEEKDPLFDEVSVEMKLEPVSLHERHISLPCSGINQNSDCEMLQFYDKADVLFLHRWARKSRW